MYEIKHLDEVRVSAGAGIGQEHTRKMWSSQGTAGNITVGHRALMQKRRKRRREAVKR
jgi:hypothetical protein